MSNGVPRKAPERIVTDRLLLRRPRQGDAETIFARYAGDPEVTRLLAWPTHTSPEVTRAFIAMSDAQWRDRPAGPMLIFSRTNGGLLGSTGLTFHASGQVETGYLISRDAWGHGYASEALRGILDLAAAIGIPTVHAHCHTGHAASIRVLEKCGFVREGIVSGFITLPNLRADGPSDVYLYAISLERRRRQRCHILASRRLGFSIWTPDDVALAETLWGDERVTALIDARGKLDAAQVRERLEEELRTQQEEGISYWPLFELASGRFAGCCGLRPYRPAEKVYELGVHLRPDCWAKGFADEACRAVIAYAFGGELGAHALFAGHHPQNEASRRLLRRLGFRPTGDELYPPTGLRHPSYLLTPDAGPAPAA